MAPDPPLLSIVVPCHNEAPNLRPLHQAISRACAALGAEYEILITDDASTDDSWHVLRQLAREDPRVRIQRLARNCGESAASWAGMRAARGRFIATLDADLQNDPAELPRFFEALREQDCVCGTRVAHRGEGDSWLRVASSRVANAVRNSLSGERISDAGCTYRVFRRECIQSLKFFKGMHRFLPTLIRMEGFSVAEIPIRHHRRNAGKSHYGVWNRVFASLLDLLAVRWMQRRMFLIPVAERVNLEEDQSASLSPSIR